MPAFTVFTLFLWRSVALYKLVHLIFFFFLQDKGGKDLSAYPFLVSLDCLRLRTAPGSPWPAVGTWYCTSCTETLLGLPMGHTWKPPHMCRFRFGKRAFRSSFQKRTTRSRPLGLNQGVRVGQRWLLWMSSSVKQIFLMLTSKSIQPKYFQPWEEAEVAE